MHGYHRLCFLPMTKKVQVVGAPPTVQWPPATQESDSDAEVPQESEHIDEHGDEEEHGDDDMDELMNAFEDDETDLDLTHLRIKSTKNMHLARFHDTLVRLVLRQNEIRSMRGKDLGAVPHLQELDLYDNAIEHISGLENNLELEILDLSFNNIRHVSRVSHLPRCHTLYLVQNKIAHIRPTDLQPPIAWSLRSLELGGNRLRSLENLSHLTNLEELWVGKNKITSLQGIAPLTKLRVLSIQSNRLTKLEGLETLTALEELYLSHNGIEKLENLEHNTQLTTLDFCANQVTTIEHVRHLSRLSQFWANDNLIADLNRLDAHLGPQYMPHLDTVYLEGNPGQKSEGANYRRKVQLALPQIAQLDATLVRRS